MLKREERDLGPAADTPARAGAAHVSRWSPAALFAGGAVLAVILPVLIFGPWLPLLDLVGFVGMYSYPPQQSYGPLHYYLFQLSYSGVLILSRLCCDLQLPVRFQVPLYYLFEVGVCLGIVYGTVKRLIPNTWAQCVAVALGTIALWDGIFLWGGPLAHSLGACFLSWATFLAMRDAAEAKKNASFAIAALVLFAICCHPFIFPFALVFCGVRFLFDRRHRWQTALLAGAVLLFGFIIYRDSPQAEVSAAAGGLFQLFSVKPSIIWVRFVALFFQDDLFARLLFGHAPISSQIVFIGFALLHLIGFVVSPFIVWKERESAWLRMLAALNTCAAILYFLSTDLPNNPIGEWPQRVLTLYAPFTFLTGFLGVRYLFTRLLPSFSTKLATPPRAAWLVPIAILVFAVLVQSQVFVFGRSLEASISRTRDQILKSGVEHAYVVVSGMDDVHPFYLRAVPFVLFSDRDLLQRDLAISTEWHVKSRHPTRMAESNLDLGRKRYLAEFASQGADLNVRMIPQPADRFPVHERTNQTTWLTPGELAADQFRRGTALFSHGLFQSAFEHFNTEIYLLPNEAQAWDDAGASLFKAGKPADAMPYFKRAVALDATMVQARINLAASLIETGRSQEAIPQLKEALRLQPDSASAAGLLKDIQAIPAATSPKAASR